jgi:hypothetical protein
MLEINPVKKHRSGQRPVRQSGPAGSRAPEKAAKTRKRIYVFSSSPTSDPTPPTTDSPFSILDSSQIINYIYFAERLCGTLKRALGAEH